MEPQRDEEDEERDNLQVNNLSERFRQQMSLQSSTISEEEANQISIGELIKFVKILASFLEGNLVRAEKFWEEILVKGNRNDKTKFMEIVDNLIAEGNEEENEEEQNDEDQKQKEFLWNINFLFHTLAPLRFLWLLQSSFSSLLQNVLF